MLSVLRIDNGAHRTLCFIEPESFTELLVRGAAALLGICWSLRLGKNAQAEIQTCAPINSSGKRPLSGQLDE